MTDHREYPRIRVSGSPRERGEQYGRQARERVHASRAGYEKVFRHGAGLSWPESVESVRHLVAPVAEAYPRYLEEMEGIATGAELAFEDVFTMNARTEVIWSAAVRHADVDLARYARECSAFALMPTRTEDGHTLIGQNWDWLVHSFDSLVVLEVEQTDGPNFVTLVEAGLLAKTSMNSAGIGVTVNAMVSSLDRAESGIPFHVLIRALADSESVTAAIQTASKHRRASSGNYLVASADGLAVDLETMPGDYRGVLPRIPVNGALVHANHFLGTMPEGSDLVALELADSLIRQQRIETTIAGASAPATLDTLRIALSDHADYPASVCCHSRPEDDEADRWASVGSVVMDLDDRVLHLSDGNPCEHPYRRLTFDGLLDGAPIRTRTA